jgi:hypothetical protein
LDRPVRHGKRGICEILHRLRLVEDHGDSRVELGVDRPLRHVERGNCEVLHRLRHSEATLNLFPQKREF